jgi:PRTRC genetic system protein F
MIHWHGEENERECLREMLDEGDSQTHWDGLTAVELYRHMPRWTSDLFTGPNWAAPTRVPGRAAPTSDELHEIWRRHDGLKRWHGHIAGDLLDLCLAMEAARAETTEPLHQTDERWFEDYGPAMAILVQWDERDQMPRLFDDWGQDFANAGGSDLAAVRTLDCRDPVRLKASIQNIAAHVRLIAAVERVLVRLADMPPA